MVQGIFSEELGKVVEIEDLERARGGYLANGGGQKALRIVEVPRLHKDGRVRLAGGIDLHIGVDEADALAYVAASVLDGGVAVHVGQLAQAEAVVVVHGRVGEAVHKDLGGDGLEHLAYSGVELVIRDAAPILRRLHKK